MERSEFGSRLSGRHLARDILSGRGLQNVNQGSATMLHSSDAATSLEVLSTFESRAWATAGSGQEKAISTSCRPWLSSGNVAAGHPERPFAREHIPREEGPPELNHHEASSRQTAPRSGDPGPLAHCDR